MLLTKGKVETLGLCRKARSQTQNPNSTGWRRRAHGQVVGRPGGRAQPRGSGPHCQRAPGRLREGLSNPAFCSQAAVALALAVK